MLISLSCDTLHETFNFYTYPKLQVAHPINDAKCFTSSGTSIDTAGVEFHEKPLSNRTKPTKETKEYHEITKRFFS